MAKVQEHREFESRVKKLRDTVKKNSVDYDKSEVLIAHTRPMRAHINMNVSSCSMCTKCKDHLKALQSVGQIIGEVGVDVLVLIGKLLVTASLLDRCSVSWMPNASS